MSILAWFSPTRWLLLLGLCLSLTAGYYAWRSHERGIGEIAGAARVQALWDKSEITAAAARKAAAFEQEKIGDKAAASHAAALTTLQKQLEKAREQISLLSDRECLGAATVSLLNTATGVQPGRTPAASPESAPPAPAAVAGLRYATERDVADYIALIRTRYAQVADQLNQILDIEDKRHPPTKAQP